MSIEHLNDVVQLEEECFSSPWNKNQFESAISSNNYILLGHIEQGELLAYLLVSSVLDYSEIINIATKPSRRQKGYAHNLLNYFIQNNKGQIILEVASKNLPAIKLYEKLGFKNISLRKNYYKDDDAFVMEYNA